jgi:hypothetical protein
MDSDSAKKLIEKLLDYQFDLLWVQDCWGVNHAEFVFVETARLLNAHPEIRTWFLSFIESTMKSNFLLKTGMLTRPNEFVPHEFIFFFVHLTRWPEFTQLADKMRKSDSDIWHSNLITKWSKSLNDAMSDSWEDRDMYRTFSAKSNGLLHSRGTR